MFQASPAIGDVFGRVTGRCINRTGATLLRGQVAMLDWSAADGDTTTIPPGASTSRFVNTIKPTTAGIEAGVPHVICLNDSVADNVEFDALYYGFEPLLAYNDASATTDIDKGDPIGCVNDQAFLEAGTANARIFGYWYEDAHATLNQLKLAFWWGGVPGLGTTF
jgi:hypothetical protein